MIKFNINKENVNLLTSIGDKVKSMAQQTKTIFLPKENSMSVNLFSSRNAVSYMVDISDLESDEISENGLDFFSLELEPFCMALVKVSESGQHDVSIKVDKMSNKVYFISSESETTQVGLATFNTSVTYKDAEDSINAVQSLLDKYFQTCKVVEINNEVLKVFDVAYKFISAAKRSNSIAINHNKIRYADGLITFEKELEKDVSPYDTDTYLMKSMVDFIRPFQKMCNVINLEITMENDKVHVEFPSLGNLQAVLGLEPCVYAYPEKSEIEAVLPMEDSCVVVETSKDSMIKGIKHFDGLFKSSNWLWKNATFDVSSQYLNDGKIRLYHSDYSADGSKTVDVKVISNTENVGEGAVMPLISLEILQGLLELVPSDTENLTITFNSKPPMELHGGGIKIEAGQGLWAMIIKLLNND